VAVQHSQKYFGDIFKGNCIMCVAEIDLLWAQWPSKEGEMARLLLCDLEQKDVTRLMKSIKSNLHSAGELWIVAVVCDEGSPPALSLPKTLLHVTLITASTVHSNP
jgi:hypothetical protein